MLYNVVENFKHIKLYQTSRYRNMEQVLISNQVSI